MPTVSKSSMLHRFSLIALSLAITLPFLGAHHRLPIATFHQEWLAGILGVVALFFVACSRQTTVTWSLPRTALFPLAFVVLAWLQFALGADVLFESTVILSLYLVWAFVLMLVTATLIQACGRDDVANTLAWSLLVGALLVAGTAALQQWTPWIGLPFIFPSGTLIGNIAQANNYADYLWLGIACAGYLFACGKLPLPGLLSAAIPLLAFSLLSGSRSVYFYSLVLSGLFAFWAWTEQGKIRQRLGWAALALIPMLFLIQWLVSLQGVSVSSAQRLVAQGSYDPVRLTLWRAALDIFLEHPLLGDGFDSFSRNFYERIQNFPINGVGIPEHSHNLLTELLAEFGLLGVTLLISGIAVWFISLRRTAGTSKYLALGLLAILGIHSLLEYPLWYAHFLAIAVVALTLGDGHFWHFSASPRHRLMAAFIGVAGIFILLNLRSDYIDLEDASQGQSYEGRRLIADEQRESLLKIYSHSLLRPYAALQFAARMPIEAKDLKLRIELLREAKHFSPIRQAVFRYAALLQLDGQHEEAARQLRQAMLTYPSDIPATLTLFKTLEDGKAEGTEKTDLTPLIQMLEQTNQRSF